MIYGIFLARGTAGFTSSNVRNPASTPEHLRFRDLGLGTSARDEGQGPRHTVDDTNPALPIVRNRP